MEPLFTPEQLAEIKAYHLPGYVFAGVDLVVYPLLLLLILLVLHRPFYRWAEAGAAGLERRFGGLRTAPVTRILVRVMDRLWGEPGWGAALLFAVFLDLYLLVLYTPLDIYFGYIREHQYGMSAYTPLTYAIDAFKGIAIGSLATSALVVGMYGLARRVKRWWLVLGVPVALLLLVAAALDPYRSRVFFDQSPLAAGPLRESITDLMKRADVTFADVLVEKSSVASKRIQGYFAGQGPTRTIVLNDVMVQKLDTREVLAVVAHEAGHIHEPKWPGRIASSVLLVVLLYVIHRLLMLAAERGWFGATRFADVRTLPFLYLFLYLTFALAQPVAGAFSREREREADRYALRLTGDVDGFRSMLVKAARLNKIDPDPPRWVVLKGMSHPPLAERLAAVPTP
ncbi:M48 family metalloprotease [Myxococcaceae bacterium GXIMD 01537]